MADSPSSKDDAQARADQIAAFRAEVEALDRDGRNPFTVDQLTRLAAYHDTLLARLAGEFDIDRTIAERRMSAGLRLASIFGAAALTAAVVSFVYRVWGTIPTPGQVVLLTTAPMLAVAATIVAGRLEKTRYVAAILALTACGAFVTQTLLLGHLFNLRSSPHTLAFWGAFALAIATPWRFVLPFGLGVLAVICYLSALLFWLAGVPWTDFAARPEPSMAIAALLLPFAGRAPRELVVATRSVLLVLVLGSLLLLSGFTSLSLLPWEEPLVESVYQLMAAVVTMGVIAVGVRRGEDEIVMVGALFGGLFLLTRFVDWWWDWMPRYLFFLILAAVSMAWIGALRVARRHAQPEDGMSWRPFALALAVPLAFTVATVAAVVINRAETRDTIVLTEREVTVDAGDEGRSGVTLWLSWAPERPGDERWLPPDRLASLGFDTTLSPAAPGAVRHYARQLQRSAYVAFELRDDQPGRSRLIPVDADRDAEALRRRWSRDRVPLIAPAVLAIHRSAPPNNRPFVDVTIVTLEPRGIHVPTELAGSLVRRRRRDGAPLRVTMRYGARYEPWVTAVD